MANRDHVPGLGDKLRSARETAQLSQMQAGVVSGVHHVSIARYETEERTPTLAAMYKLAEAYGVTVADLLPEPPKPAKKSRKSS